MLAFVGGYACYDLSNTGGQAFSSLAPTLPQYYGKVIIFRDNCVDGESLLSSVRQSGLAGDDFLNATTMITELIDGFDWDSTINNMNLE